MSSDREKGPVLRLKSKYRSPLMSDQDTDAGFIFVIEITKDLTLMIVRTENNSVYMSDLLRLL